MFIRVCAVAVVLTASCGGGAPPSHPEPDASTPSDAAVELDAEVAPDAGECTGRLGPCDDRDPCTEADLCVGGECVGRPVTCDDGNECTEDSCEPGTGECDHAHLAACVFLEWTRDPAASSYLGSKVAIRFDTLAASATPDSPYTRTLTIWTRAEDEWSVEATLNNPSGSVAQQFGNALATDGDRVAVGAEEAGDDVAGKVYVYERSGGAWNQAGEITGNAYDRLGASVAFAGGWLLAGAPQNTSFREGRVTVYEQDGSDWVEVARLLPPDPDVDGAFGSNVAADGEVVVVSDPAETVNGEAVGAAYVATGAGADWSELTRLAPVGGPVVDGFFGAGLAVSAELVVVGAPGEDGWVGAAYVFELDGTEWVAVERLQPEGLAAWTHFGSAVAVREGRIVVGGTPHGAYVYVKQDGRWTHWLTVGPPDDVPVEFSAFGSAVAVSDMDLVVSDATGNDGVGLPSGAVFVGYLP